MDRDKILQFIRMRGMVVPVQLASEIKQNTIITGAILAEMVKSRVIEISNTKVGGSPVYYVKESRHRLQELYKYLNEKDRRSYDLLKERKILRDNELTPLLRVSLRNIKDFAKALEVNTGSGREIFWKWYLLSNDEAEKTIRNMLSPRESSEQKEVQQAGEKPGEGADKEAHGTDPVQQPAPGAKAQANRGPGEPANEPEAAAKKPDAKAQTHLVPAEKRPPAKDLRLQDSLHDKTKKYFNSKGIAVISVEVVRKNAEMDYVVDVPSQVGNITYYCKAKAKKRCNDGDLAAAYVKGQLKKLPVLFITTGELTKKAKEMLDREFQNMKIHLIKG